MSNYYTKRDAKVRIAEKLMKKDWKVFGYKEDESDSMTDYYSPADWDGVATKNGYTLVIDNRSGYGSGKEITKYNPNYKKMTLKNRNTLENLKNMTIERGATPGEAENAKLIIEKINKRYKDQKCSKYEIIGQYPTFQGNSKGCIWHIEKNSALVDRGNKLTIFADMPEDYIFDINNMKFRDSYKYHNTWEYNEQIRKERILSKEEIKAIKEFKAFILRIERVVNDQNTCGDGTKETEEEGLNQQNKEQFKKVTKTINKNVIELKEVNREDSLQVGDIFWQNSYGYLKVYEVLGESKIYRCVKIGTKNRGYQESKSINSRTTWNKKSIDRSVKNGYIKVYNVVEVKKTETIEKWEKIRKSAKSNTDKKEETNKSTLEKENTINIIYNEEKNGIELSFGTKPEKEALEALKENGFRWHKIKKVWYTKDTAERRNFINTLVPGEIKEGMEKNKKNEKKEVNEDIEEGFLYDCHFKVWNYSKEEIENKLISCSIPKEKFYFYIDKVIFENLNDMETLTVHSISTLNGSIFFMDNKRKIKEVNNVINLEEFREEIKEDNNVEINFDDIMNQFDNVEIKNENRINTEDLAVIEKLQKNFDKIKEGFKKYIDFIRENKLRDLKGKEITISIDTIEEKFIKEIIIPQSDYFIDNVFSYFKNKYNINLNIDKYNLFGNSRYRNIKKLDWYMKDLDYNLLLDDIFNQLEGKTFEDKAFKEISSFVSKKVGIWGNDKYLNIKGKNIILKNYIRFDSFDIKYGNYKLYYTYYDEIKNLLSLIGYYNHKDMNCYDELYKKIAYNNNNIIDAYELGEKIISMTIRKNGSIQLSFKDGITALNFAKICLSYSNIA